MSGFNDGFYRFPDTDPPSPVRAKMAYTDGDCWVVGRDDQFYRKGLDLDFTDDWTPGDLTVMFDVDPNQITSLEDMEGVSLTQEPDNNWSYVIGKSFIQDVLSSGARADIDIVVVTAEGTTHWPMIRVNPK